METSLWVIGVSIFVVSVSIIAVEITLGRIFQELMRIASALETANIINSHKQTWNDKGRDY